MQLMCMHGKYVVLWIAIATEHGRYGPSCMQKLWSAQILYGMLECIAAEHADIFYTGRLVSEQ